jgi:polyisoprenoid-binding protein YceI
MKSALLKSSLIALVSATAAIAAPKAFDFKDPKGVNAARFNLDAPLEAIAGTGNGISGTVHYDPTNPGSVLKGELVLSTASLTVPNGTMQEHLHSDQWLDVAAHPEIRFTAESVSKVQTDGNKTTAHVTGTLSVKGVTKSITIPVDLTYLPGKLADRTGGQMQGDLLVLRSNFSINRSEFGIMPGQMTDKVAEEIELSFALAGHHAAKGKS